MKNKAVTLKPIAFTDAEEGRPSVPRSQSPSTRRAPLTGEARGGLTHPHLPKPTLMAVSLKKTPGLRGHQRSATSDDPLDA